MAHTSETAELPVQLPFAVPRTGDLLGEKYRVEAVLGRGGMGVVLAATNQLTNRKVALKWMLPQLSGERTSLQRLLMEAQIAGGIDHPNVISIYDVGFQGDSAFIVMERLQGELLSALLARRESLDVSEALALLLPVMDGVQAAHERSAVHRDLKPENIFICQRTDGSTSQVKVLDFGISKLLSESAVELALTQTGALIGTPYYMSPEQVGSFPDLDQRVDVYALGVILYETMTGQLPFQSDNYIELLLQIGSAPVKSPAQIRSDLPEGLDAVILKAMARDRAQRFDSVHELRAALEPYLATPRGQGCVAAGAISEPRTSALPMPAPRPKASPVRPWLLPVAALLVVLSMGVRWLALEERPGTAPAHSLPAKAMREPARPFAFPVTSSVALRLEPVAPETLVFTPEPSVVERGAPAAIRGSKRKRRADPVRNLPVPHVAHDVSSPASGERQKIEEGTDSLKRGPNGAPIVR